MSPLFRNATQLTTQRCAVDVCRGHDTEKGRPVGSKERERAYKAVMRKCHVTSREKRLRWG